MLSAQRIHVWLVHVSRAEPMVTGARRNVLPGPALALAPRPREVLSAQQEGPVLT